MHDNARPHTARIVTNYLDTVEIPRLERPARRPDMNPIEHVWDHLGRNVKKRQPLPETIQELRIALYEEWEQMPQEEIQHVIESKPRRIETLPRCRGGYTRY
jgi:transposase